jgi:hypothetical protein
VRDTAHVASTVRYDDNCRGVVSLKASRVPCAGSLVHPFRKRSFEKRETKEKRGGNVKRERAFRMFSDLSLQSILLISHSINRLTGTDGFRLLCHQFFISSLFRLATCLSRFNACWLKMKSLTPALLR